MLGTHQNVASECAIENKYMSLLGIHETATDSCFEDMQKIYKTNTIETILIFLVDAEGFDIFPNLKSESKKGLYFKLVMHDMDFEQASNHCVTVGPSYS